MIGDAIWVIVAAAGGLAWLLVGAIGLSLQSKRK